MFKRYATRIPFQLCGSILAVESMVFLCVVHAPHTDIHASATSIEQNCMALVPAGTDYGSSVPQELIKHLQEDKIIYHTYQMKQEKSIE
jgi:hypothetical protein